MGPVRSRIWGWTCAALVLLVAGRPARAEETRNLPPPRVLGGPSRARPAPPPRRETPAYRPRPLPDLPRGALPPPRVRVLRGRPVEEPTEAPRRFPAPDADDPALLEEIALPAPPPPRPPGRVEPGPEDIVFEVDRPGGIFRRFPDGPGRSVFVMLGNPHIQGFEHEGADGTVVAPFSIQANRLVVWVDDERIGPLGGGIPSARDEGTEGDGDAPAQDAWTLLQEAVLGIYGDGAVQLEHGDLVFRSERVYVEPGANRALLIEPSFEGSAAGSVEQGDEMPLYVRARRARVVAKGVAVFDSADVSGTKASDRFEIRVNRLTIRELEEGTDETDPQVNLLGFRNLSSQTYDAEDIHFRGERIPIFFWQRAEFGYPDEESFPYRYRMFDYSTRTSPGPAVTFGFGAPIGGKGDRWGFWSLYPAAYFDRGPALGVDVVVNRADQYVHPYVWGIYDTKRRDFNDFEAPSEFRWIANVESRFSLEKWVEGLTLDAEYHDFSDRNVNLEFFEYNQLTHKGYETYVRPRYQRGAFVGTLLTKFHVRDFETETTALPELELWFTSIPLLSGSTGGPSVDVSSELRGGRLERNFDEDLDLTDYAANRLQTDTRVNVAYSLGDVRLSGYGGVYAADYLNRTDGEADLLRAALLAGARANVQAHRSWSADAGFFQLDGLRHVVDVDGGFAGRWFNDTTPDQAPYFDLTDTEEERSAAVLSVRNRLQTRDEEGVRDLFDLELVGRYYVDEVGPYGIRAPGEIDYVLRGRPRRTLFVAGEGRWDVENAEFQRASFGVGAKPSEKVAFITGLRYLRGQATAPFVDVGWRWSEKYGVRVYEQYDFTYEENFLKVVFGRYSPDHALLVGFSARGTDDYNFEFNFSPNLDRVSGGELQPAMDAPGVKPWGAFR